MGLWGGIKKIGRGAKKVGRGIGKGVKKGVKAFDKFDDWIKLKELAQIGQFIPGVNVIAKPLAMTYAGFDAAKGIKNKDLLGAGLAGLQMYGSSKIDTGGLAGRGASSLAPMAGEALPEGIQAAAGQVGGQSLRQAVQSNIGGNLRNYAGGMNAPFNAYSGLDEGSKFAVDTLAPPILNQLQGDQGQRQGPIPSYDYQPMNYGPSQGFSPTTQFPTQAQGGITGDDWHQPINRLPANYEGWVTQPSLATLGEAGKEAVLPLNKLIPAMNKGGLNYSPGQAIVGEAGPEYVKRLGPGEEQYAQSILQQQPLPQMKEGGVAGGVAKGLKRAVFPRTRPGWQQGRVGAKVLGKAGKWIPGLGFVLGAGQAATDTYDLYQGTQSGKEYGLGDYSQDMLSNLLYSVPFVGPVAGTAYDYKRGELDELIELLGEVYDGDESLASERYGPEEENPYAAQAFSNGQRVRFAPGTSENEIVHGVSSGQFNNTPASRTPVQTGIQASTQTVDPLELLRQTILEEGTGDIGLIEPPNFMEGRPSVDDLQSEWRGFGSPKERIDLSLLDNDNARYWTTGEGSRYAPGRLYDMIRDMGYGDTREQVKEIQRNARNKEKWYRAATKEAEKPRWQSYEGPAPG